MLQPPQVPETLWQRFINSHGELPVNSQTQGIITWNASQRCCHVLDMRSNYSIWSTQNQIQHRTSPQVLWRQDMSLTDLWCIAERKASELHETRWTSCLVPTSLRSADQETVATVAIFFVWTLKFHDDICSIPWWHMQIFSATLSAEDDGATSMIWCVRVVHFRCILTCLFKYINPPQEDEYEVMTVPRIKPPNIDELRHKRATCTDAVLQKLTHIIQNGWSEWCTPWCTTLLWLQRSDVILWRNGLRRWEDCTTLIILTTWTRSTEPTLVQSRAREERVIYSVGLQ